MTGTSPRRNADSVRPECASHLAKSAPGPRCAHRCGDGLVDPGERNSGRRGRAGRFRGDDNGGQEFSVSGQYQRAEPHGDYSFDQSLANTSEWRSGYSARIAKGAAWIVSPGGCGPISSQPIRSSAKPIAWRICIRLQTRLFSKERRGSVSTPVGFDKAVIAQDGDA